MPESIFQSKALSEQHESSVPASHRDGTAVIDADAFDELLAVCEVETTPEYLCEILEDFLADTVAQLTALRQAVSANDPVLMDQAAHALKASSSNVAAARMAELCLTLQVMGRSGNLAGAVEQIQQLENEFDKVSQVFVNECQRRRDAFAAGQ